MCILLRLAVLTGEFNVLLIYKTWAPHSWASTREMKFCGGKCIIKEMHVIEETNYLFSENLFELKYVGYSYPHALGCIHGVGGCSIYVIVKFLQILAKTIHETNVLNFSNM